MPSKITATVLVVPINVDVPPIEYFQNSQYISNPALLVFISI